MTSDTAPVLITGFHRSGTSVAARVLAASGLDLGTDLIGPRASNRDGHFEDRDAVALHDRLLAGVGEDWMTIRSTTIPVGPDDRDAMRGYVRGRSSSAPVWGLKDPRAVHFVDTWLEIGVIALVVLVRRPAEAVMSLMRREARRLRNGRTSAGALFADADLALRMWLGANTVVLEHASHAMIVTHESLTAGFPLAAAVAAKGVDLAPVPTLVHVDPAPPGRPAPRLRASRSLVDEAEALYGELSSLAAETAHVA